MTNNGTSGASKDLRLAEVLDAYLAGVRAGMAPAPDMLLAEHPDLAGDLQECLTSLAFLRQAGQPGTAEAPANRDGTSCELGDYRIVREIGRGGMCIVYEAEQVSLGRRVALKVLPLAATMDPRHLQRFHNEARAAAGLHHTNIVPVYYVGCERGVHYYAMQFIDGQSLAALLEQQRTPRPEPAPQTRPAAETAASAATRTAPAPRDAAYFRRVAEWGIQAAEALDHAHQMGIVHRDVKPANLLVDAAGRLWITDFGLAQMQSDVRLTMTGDLVGTLRYMSPEQAMAKRVVVDHRTDIYSLGATLYELLTLEPAFRGTDRQELLRQIAFEEPTAPRRLNRAIPPELQTIVLKALEKNPTDRYATAQELAHDLQRFLHEEPIRARRPPLAMRLQKWRRRHPAAAASAFVGLVLLLVSTAVAAGYQQRLLETERRVTAALAQVDVLLEDADKLIDHPERWQAAARLALAAQEKAEELLATGVATNRLTQRVENDRRAVEAAVTDSGLLIELERIRLEQASAAIDRFHDPQSPARYATALARHGIDIASPEPAGARIRNSRLRPVLVAALEDWLRVTKDGTQRRQLEQALQAVDPGERSRARWRDALRRRHTAALVEMAKSLSQQQAPSAIVCVRAADLRSVGAWNAGEKLLKTAQRRTPGDFWLNHELGLSILQRGRAEADETARVEEAIGYLRAALALRPDSPYALINLGAGLRSIGDWEGAIACFRAATESKPETATPHYNLGSVLHDQRKLDQAIAAYRRAIDIDPNFLHAHDGLGVALRSKGQTAEAIACFRKAIAIDVNDARAHAELGKTLQEAGKADEAIACFHKAIEVAPKCASAHAGLGMVFRAMGKKAEALECFRATVALDPKLAPAHSNLGIALAEIGKLEEALECCKRAVALDPKLAAAHYNLGGTWLRQGNVAEAIACYSKAIELDPNLPKVHNDLATVLARTGKLEAAIVSFKRAIEIEPTDFFAHLNLATTLRNTGNFAEALSYLRRGHELGSGQPGWPNPSGSWVREYERLVELDAKLARVLKGAERPADAGEQLRLAELCAMPYKSLFAAAARFYTDAFAAQPQWANDPRGQRRYNAACAAALAGCGKGKDAAGLSETERAGLRRQALDWLRADLAAWTTRLNSNPDQARPVVVKLLRHWQTDTDFAGVRGDALARLPTEERQAWQKLWGDVADTLARAEGKTAADRKGTAK